MGNEKLKFLDGIRGIMALNVVISHFASIYYPQMMFTQFDTGDVLSLFAYTPLSVFVNGNVAVQYFFVLTGFLVARTSFMGRELDRRDIVVKSINRYLRLMPVVAGAVFFAWLTTVLKLQKHGNIIELVANGAWFQEHVYYFPPTISRLLLNALYEPFILGGSDYIASLWTIQYELWGYIISMLTCYFFKDFKLRRLGYLIVGLLLWLALDQNYLPFMLGILTADLCYRTESDTTYFSKFYHGILYRRWFAGILFLIGGYLACCPLTYGGIHMPLSYIPKLTERLARASGMAILVFCLVQTPTVARFFESKWMCFFGKISYSLYAFHLPIMLSLEAGLFAWLVERTGYDVAAVGAFAISFLVMIVAALLSHRILEKPLDIRKFGNKRSLIY